MATERRPEVMRNPIEGQWIPKLREAVNLGDAIERDALVRKRMELREEAALDLATLEHWNRTHPEEEPFDTSFERGVIAWLDGEGPFPKIPESRAPESTGGDDAE